MSLTFEWDASKALESSRKPTVDLEESAPAFLDPLSLAIPDPDHSVEEQRWVLIGESAIGRLLVVVHADRGHTIKAAQREASLRRERQSDGHR